MVQLDLETFKLGYLKMNQPEKITLDMMRQSLYSAVVCDALDGLGFTNQSPRTQLLSLTVDEVLVGRCRTTSWEDIDFEDPAPDNATSLYFFVNHASSSYTFFSPSANV